jgi:hypothetical protein
MAVEKPSRKIWQLKAQNETWQVVRRGEASAEELRTFNVRMLSPQLIERWLNDPLASAAMLEMCRQLIYGTPLMGSARTAGERADLRRYFMTALERADLILIQPKRQRIGSADAPAPEASQGTAPRPQPAPVAEKSWIEIVLKDRRGRPIPKEKFRIVLPDGTVFEGKLDDNGKARKDTIDPGMCTISFPELGRRRSTS